MRSKVCYRCKGPLPYSSGWCSKCTAAYRLAKLDKENPDRDSFANRRKRGLRRDHPGFAMLHAARFRAKQAGVPCTIYYDDITVPDICPVLGIPLDGSHFDTRPSIDRVIPAKGYVPGNIKVISMRANRIKTDSTIEELEKVLQYYKENSG